MSKVNKTTLDEIVENEEYLLQGHTACPGCGATLALRHVTKALGQNTVFVIPACCSSVFHGIWPHSAFDFHTFNTAFASAPAVASGIKRGLRAKGNEETQVVAWGGDGGIVDIGFAALSGAAERNEDIIVICYDNEAYMNTGIQRSGATPPGASTTTTHTGKQEMKKQAPFILLEHDVPYVATASSAHPMDLYTKVKKAKETRGFSYIHILSPCTPGWRLEESKSVESGKIAIKTGYWALWDAERADGELNFELSPQSKKYIDPEEREPIERFLEIQGRFRRMSENQTALIKKQIKEQWRKIERYIGGNT